MEKETMNSVQWVKNAKECCGCGICGAVCPRHAITMEITRETGKTEPEIADTCVNCGICLQVCPQRKSADRRAQEDIPLCVTLYSKDTEIRENAVSGGFITTLVKALLEQGIYETAFLVDGNAYGKVVQTSAHTSSVQLQTTSKSRYLQVAHTDEVTWLLEHPDKKAILVGTPCYFRGLLKVMDKFRLSRENYLCIGLFCDKTMTANVWDYFNHMFAGDQLLGLDFRNKGADGWPGDVCLHLQDGTEKFLSRRERMDVKEYFMPECCLSCMDKLNPLADISVGDDYIHSRMKEKGANTVLFRTGLGQAVWEQVKPLFEWEDCTYEQVYKSQHMESRQKLQQRDAAELQRKLALGQSRAYDRIQQEIRQKRKVAQNPVRRILRKWKQLVGKS